jgi:hypothetical protein
MIDETIAVLETGGPALPRLYNIKILSPPRSVLGPEFDLESASRRGLVHLCL